VKIRVKGKLRTLWHLTTRKSFKPSEKIQPFIGIQSRPVLYATTDPYFWTHVITWASGRRWAAEIDILPGHPPFEPENPVMRELELHPRYVRVVRIVPMAEAIAESTTKADMERARLERERRLRRRELDEQRRRKARLLEFGLRIKTRR